MKSEILNLKSKIFLLAIFCCAPNTAAGPIDPRAAYELVDLQTGRVVRTARSEQLQIPVLPGSTLKVATLIAALESKVVTADTRLVCRRDITVDGHRLTCSHPVLGRGLTSAEALAHSCNSFFADVAARVPRATLNQVLARLGLPPISSTAPLVASALGLDGPRVEPRLLLSMIAKVTAPSDAFVISAETRRVVLDGLRGAARYGTAEALGARGIDAFAKTGTAPMRGGGYQGLVAAVTPTDTPRFGVVVLAPGAAGRDAAVIAADILQAHQSDQTVAVGIVQRDGTYRRVTLPLEQYVAGVVEAEAAPESGAAAKQALAIVARSFALANRGRHAKDGFDFCDLTHCQVMRAAGPSAMDAARATEGRVLLHEGKVAQVFYTASCGGRSERPSAVWPGLSGQLPFMDVHEDEACGGKPAWTTELDERSILKALRLAGRKGEQIRNLRVVGRSPSNRASLLEIEGLTPSRITGDDFRLALGRTLGWNQLKSTLFEVTRTGNGYRFVGSGLGHGVGLCLLGASVRAARGDSATAILQAYFQGAIVGPIPSPESTASQRGRMPQQTDLRVVLPTDEESRREEVTVLIRSIAANLSRSLSLALPPRLLVRFHPSVESYQRATGRPWWTAAASKEEQIDLIPLASLRSRGRLEPTLQHELVHVLTEPTLRGQPLWVREGLAVHIAGEPIESKGDRCPTDIELMRPRSSVDLKKAYERAGACVAEQLGSGRKWDQIDGRD